MEPALVETLFRIKVTHFEVQHYFVIIIIYNDKGLARITLRPSITPFVLQER